MRLPIRQGLRAGTRRWLFALLIAVFVVGLAWACWTWWSWNHRYSFNPIATWRPVNEYIIGVPGFLSYCSIRLGTPEAKILAKLGPPAKALDTDSAEWRELITGLHRAGWRVPSPPYARRVLYYAPGRYTSLMFYYFIGEDGRLVNTFVGET